MPGIILDTASGGGTCDFCREHITPDEPQVIIGLRRSGRQWFKFLHWECAVSTLDITWPKEIKK